MSQQKNHQEEAFLTLLIKLDRERIVGFESALGTVTMLPFGGSAEGKLFKGIIEPCGVDTQITDQNGVRHMSARYMLTGEDNTGASCHIYVENNAYFTGTELPAPFRTVPTFLTDSSALAPYLHSNRFVGEGSMEEGELYIRFYEVC